MKNQFAILLIGLLITGSVYAAPVSVSQIKGYTISGFVSNGRWTGQPISNAKSNAYKDMLAIESQSDTATFTIIGKNFGSKQGSVHFLTTGLSKVSGVTVSIKSWKDTEVQVVARGLYSFTSSAGGYVRVSRDINPPPMSYDGAALYNVKGFVGLIKTRGYGQCTWFVAKTRLAAGKSIPTTAYSVTGSIASTYVPAKYDCLKYGTKHVAIITSSPTKTTKSDGTVVYTFTLSEMNAAWDEKSSTSTRTFEVKSGKIVKGIGSNAGSSYIADGYWR